MDNYPVGLSMQNCAVSAGVVLILLILMFYILSRIKKVPPNTLMVLSGLKRHYIDDRDNRQVANFRTLKGGASFVFPYVERMDLMSLEVVDLDIGTIKAATSDGSTIGIKCTAQVKVNTASEGFINIAVENLLSKSPDDIKSLSQNMLDGMLRTTLGTMTGEAFRAKREGIYGDMKNKFEAGMAKIGLQVVNFSLYVEP